MFCLITKVGKTNTWTTATWVRSLETKETEPVAGGGEDGATTKDGGGEDVKHDPEGWRRGREELPGN